MEIIQQKNIITNKKLNLVYGSTVEWGRRKNQWTEEYNTRYYPIWTQRENRLKKKLTVP